MSGLPTETLALLTRSESHIPPLSVAVNLTNHFAPTCATDSSPDAES